MLQLVQTLCETHKERGFRVTADRVVAGTPMCNACYKGSAVHPFELANAPRLRLDELRRRRYYLTHRKKILARKKRCWRQAKAA